MDKKKILKIKWQRLIFEGETCPRCGSTEKELDKAVSTLKQSLAPLGIEIVLEKEELSVSEFKEDPLQSNRIWINNCPIEDYIEGKVGQSPCCDVCGPHECRTVKIEGQVYETIPSETIIKAALAAAAQLVSVRKGNPAAEEVMIKTRPFAALPRFARSYNRRISGFGLRLRPNLLLRANFTYPQNVK